MERKSPVSTLTRSSQRRRRWSCPITASEVDPPAPPQPRWTCPAWGENPQPRQTRQCRRCRATQWTCPTGALSASRHPPPGRVVASAADNLRARPRGRRRPAPPRPGGDRWADAKTKGGRAFAAGLPGAAGRGGVQQPGRRADLAAPGSLSRSKRASRRTFLCRGPHEVRRKRPSRLTVASKSDGTSSAGRSLAGRHGPPPRLRRSRSRHPSGHRPSRRLPGMPAGNRRDGRRAPMPPGAASRPSHRVRVTGSTDRPQRRVGLDADVAIGGGHQ